MYLCWFVDSVDNVLLPVLIGVTAIVLLTLAIGAGVVCACYLRQRKRKTGLYNTHAVHYVLLLLENGNIMLLPLLK